MADDYFEKLAEKMAGGGMGRRGGNWLSGEGRYTVEIISTKRMMGFSKGNYDERNKEMFIADFKIVKSDNPNHPVDSTASWCCVGPTDPKKGAGDVKSFCIALTGIDPRSIKDSDVKANKQAALLALAAMDEAEAFKALKIPTDWFQGQLVNVETQTVKTKAGGDFTRYLWAPANDVEAEETAAA